MRAWVIGPGEPAVLHPAMAAAKPMRAALLAQELASRGHDVTLWTGRFQHHAKRHLPEPLVLRAGPRQPMLRLIRSPGYKRNISVARMIDHTVLAWNWRRDAAGLMQPDIIVASFPPPELAVACLSFARSSGVPCLLDLRDMWPDAIYFRAQAAIGGRRCPRFLPHYDRLARRATRGATGLVGITEAFLDWGLRFADRPRAPTDSVFPLSPPPGFDRAVKGAAPPIPADGRRVLAWVGTLTAHASAAALLAALDRLDPDTAARLHIVIAGTGGLEARARDLGRRLPHVTHFPYLGAAELQGLWTITDRALLPYDCQPDFVASVPNKVAEALAHGVPLLSSLRGEVEALLAPAGLIRLVQPSESGWRAALGKIAREAPPSAHLRHHARQLFRSRLDGSTLYPAYADHVEAVAWLKKGLAA